MATGLVGRPGSMNTWLIKGATDHGVNRIASWLRDGYVSIGWADSDFARVGMSREELASGLRAQDATMNIGMGMGNLDRFLNQMDEGDLVFTVEGSRVYVGRIASGAEKLGDLRTGALWQRRANWLNAESPLERDTLPAALQDAFKTRVTSTELTKHYELIAPIVARLEGESNAFADPWEPFLYWAERLFTTPEFDADERDYKLEVAENVLAFRAAVEEGRPDTTAALKKVFSPPNNLTNWRINGEFSGWMASDGHAVSMLLERLWAVGEADLEGLSEVLAEWPAKSGPGAQLSLISLFLMAVDATRYPFYRARAHRRATKLVRWSAAAGGTEPDDIGQPGADTVRPEELAAELGVTGLTVRNYLRTRYPRDPSEHGTNWSLSEEQARDVVEHFGGAAGAESSKLSLQERLVEGLGALSRPNGHVHTIHGSDGKTVAEVVVGQTGTVRLNFIDTPAGQLPSGLTLDGRAQRWQGGGTRVTEENLDACRNLLLSVVGRTVATARRVDSGAEATAERYRDYLELLDELHRRMRNRGTHLRDRLDAQGLVWWITSADPPEHWSAEDKAAFLAYQSMKEDVVVPSPLLPAASRDRKLPLATAELAGKMLLPIRWLQNILDLLEEKRQVIFYGPPGTGKTFVAQALGELIADAGGTWELVQFHPSYTYEDFFEGYRPRQDDDGDALRFRLVPGPLKLLAESAARRPDVPHLLLIDEINRGNIAKVFGELYFLLEYRERSVRLQYSPESEFSLPKNLFVIGTMNTADRSIALVDSALRRRFYFVPFLPQEEPIKSVLRSWLMQRNRSQEPADLLDALNAELDDPDFAIGPSYFMHDGGANLDNVWAYAIKPLLQEHFYGAGRNIDDEFGWRALRRRIAGDVLILGDDDAEDGELE